MLATHTLPIVSVTPWAEWPPIEQLTTREMEVLRYITHAYTNLQIAQAMFIAERTVRQHVSHILAKMHLENRLQLGVWAIKHNVFLEDGRWERTK